MMPYKRQYYDPIVQAPGTVQDGTPVDRIELYPDDDMKWHGRRVDSQGRVVEVSSGDFSHDAAQAQAQRLWPGLQVYELKNESEDSTWVGAGPSPRLWQPPPSLAQEQYAPEPLPPAVDEPDVLAPTLPALLAPKAGLFLHVDDVVVVLEGLASEREGQARIALYEAAEMFRGAQQQ